MGLRPEIERRGVAKVDPEGSRNTLNPTSIVLCFRCQLLLLFLMQNRLELKRINACCCRSLFPFRGVF